jgi:FkbM family methyltransferase
MTPPSVDIATYRSMSRQQKRSFWASHPVRGDVTIELDALAPFVMYSDNDDTVVKELYWTGFGGWEATSLHLWSCLARRVRPGTVLDVGSYSGIYALIAAIANPSHDVVGIDIQPRCLARVEINRERNGLANIRTLHAACLDTVGLVPYFYYEEADVLSSIAGVSPNRLNDRTADAPAVTIDSTFGGAAAGRRVVLMKIDIEGAEDRALRGAHQVLTSDRPDVLVEINDRSKVPLVQGLFPRGYRAYSIDDDRGLVRRIRFYAPPFRSRNFLFSTRDSREIASLLATGP